jgi:hypothetical protein
MGPLRTKFHEEDGNEGFIPEEGHGAVSTARLSLCVLILSFPAIVLAKSQMPPPARGIPASQGSVEHPLPGSIVGTIVDPSGAAVAGAQVKLIHETPSANHEALSDDDGKFFFGDVPPGVFQLTVAAEGFANQEISGILHPSEDFKAPPIMLVLATKSIEMRVAISKSEIAEEQIKQEESQRVFGLIPNFFVTYFPDTAPLTSKQKFKLAWKSTIDPATFVLTGILAGAQQARNDPSSYGQGLEGFGKRYGATYTGLFTSTLIGDAMLPSLLKQDPRYFYKGTGSVRARILYALANTAICKGDNGHWQANYSGILGDIASGALSNLYYPADGRSRVEVTFRNAGIRIGLTAAGNLLQEFLVRKLTRTVHHHIPGAP